MPIVTCLLGRWDEIVELPRSTSRSTLMGSGAWHFENTPRRSTVEALAPPPSLSSESLFLVSSGSTTSTPSSTTASVCSLCSTALVLLADHWFDSHVSKWL